MENTIRLTGGPIGPEKYPAGPVENAVTLPAILKETAEKPIDALLKRNLLIYLLVSALSFSFLVIPYRAGISVPIFVLIQAGALYHLIKPVRRKQLFVLVPVFILALNSFISVNPMWRVTNLFVAAVLYGLMALWITEGISLRDTSNRIFLRIAETIGYAFSRFPIPFKWGTEVKTGSIPSIRRVFIGIGISIPVLIFLIIMLSRADMIFSRTVVHFFDELHSLIQPGTIVRILFGFAAGLYLFGILYGVLAADKDNIPRSNGLRIVGDCLILGIVLTSVLFVYTIFVIIQFRYLFAPPDSLPYGLTFVTYARRGFFELLFLTGVNISFILVTVWLTKTQNGPGAKIVKIMCLYLCAVTVILLISSFYRMWLYGADDGLTRMRLLVFGFLIFEGIGLIFTFFYILKPKFNILLVYCLIALSYYLVLNLVPIDRIIARNQIDRYFEAGRGGIHYTLSLSPDAAPEIARLLQSENVQIQELAHNYFNRLESSTNWRQWNLSLNRARGILS